MIVRPHGKGWVSVKFSKRDRQYFMGGDTLCISQQLLKHVAEKADKLKKTKAAQ